jgi:hypothetical protein
VQQNFWADPPVERGVKVRWHHKQGVLKGFEAGSCPATDSLQRSAATTVWLVGINAVFTAPEIDHSPDLLRSSEVFSTAQ